MNAPATAFNAAHLRLSKAIARVALLKGIPILPADHSGIAALMLDQIADLPLGDALQRGDEVAWAQMDSVIDHELDLTAAFKALANAARDRGVPETEIDTATLLMMAREAIARLRRAAEPQTCLVWPNLAGGTAALGEMGISLLAGHMALVN